MNDPFLNDNSKSDSARRPAARVIPRAEHSISRAAISPNALRVLYRLREAGYEAFLVGGCVRDLLIGITPKDFDIATSALPEEVKRTFRNCRLIGRRFRLAHVFFGRDIIEVATFRAMSAPELGAEPVESTVPDLDDDEVPEDLEDDLEDDLDADDIDDIDGTDESTVLAEAGSHRTGFHGHTPIIERDRSRHAGAGAADEDDEDRVTDEHGRILRDNAYGSIDDDVWRRDFTANALYYNIADFSIWDYTGGVEDIAARRLKLIGDPATRYREDPVRMLRAARFEAKLGFTLDGETGSTIRELKELLGSVPPARLFDETLKLFLTGHGAMSLVVLQRHGLLGELLPTVAAYLDKHPTGLVAKLVRRGLENTDQRVAAGKPVTPTFLFALLLYGPFADIIEKLPQEKWHDIGTIVDAVDRAARNAQGRISIPKRFTLGVREMFAAQPRLEQPRGRRALRMLEQPRFRAGFDLLLLRAEIGLADPAIAQWWTRVQEASQTDRDRMADAMGVQPRPAGEGTGRRGPRRRRRGRGRAPAAS
ncbi:MAG TPA: polynucleotide adenylyltransferase PcnB [Steroidobacteraceae bacterium]|nr:polynucleotide adenylyltransferase PcnB [Steroidobacteraceae bacterium]